MPLNQVLYILLGCWLVNRADGFSTNPVFGKSACLYLYPSGHHVESQITESPYILMVSDSIYTPGTELKVSLVGRSADTPPFLGFILQARRLENPAETVGEFEGPQASVKKNCQDDYGGKTITHLNADPKSSLDVFWTSPTGVGDIEFKATVVQEFGIYWANISSMVVSGPALPDTARPENPKPPITQPKPVVTQMDNHHRTRRQSTLPAIDLSGCGRTKSCYRDPENCYEDCQFLVTWTTNGEDNVDFELQATLTGSEAYVALGFSSDSKMGDDSVIDCIHTGSGSVAVLMSYNPAKYNQQLVDGTRGLVSSSLQGFYSDGQILCRFTRSISLSPPVTVDDNKIFDLNQDYHILLAKGPVSSGIIAFHSATISSSSKVNVASGENVNVGGSSKFPLIKAHGILMMLAWMLCSSFAVLMPRYFKLAWPGKKCGGKDLWFMIHQCLMVATLVLTVTAFIIIFVEVGGYAEFHDFPSKLHPPLGIITTILVITNPIMAAFRCGPDAPKRRLFNAFHFGVGMCAHVCSVVTIFIGLYLSKSNMPVWTRWVMALYIVWHVLIEVALAVHMHCRKPDDEITSYELNTVDSPETQPKTTTSANPEPGSRVKTGLGMLHLIGVFSFTLALIIALGKS